MSESALSLRGIVKSFAGKPAVDGVSLDVAPGEVLALVGENGAGKSTLVSVACGLYKPDAGEVWASGRPLPPADPGAAIEAGIGVVYQHFMLLGPLTVWENVVLGREPRRALGILDRERARREVADAAARFGLAVDVEARIETLGVGAQQRVEIVKQLWRGARVLILDEPTAVLSPLEAGELVRTIRALAAEGRSVLFISHKLREVLAVADRIAVLRRGRLVQVAPGAGANADDLAAAVMGTERTRTAATPSPPVASSTPGSEIVLEARDLHCQSDRGRPALRGFSLIVRSGEMVGLAGVDGNGQGELAEVLAGLREAEGALTLRGASQRWSSSPAAARAAGVAHLPEDRHRRALCLPLSAEENLALGHHRAPPYARGIRIDREGRQARARELIEDFDVRPPDPAVRAADLSGGNQQKLVAARELAGGPPPRLVVAVQPTRGLDPGATRRVHDALRSARAAGAAVLVVSLDLDELRGLCSRIVVIYDGRAMGDAAPSTSDEELGRMMLGRANA